MTQETKLYEIVGASGMVQRVKGTHCDIDEVLPRVTVYNQGDVVGSYIDYKSLTVLSPDANTGRVDFNEYVISHDAFTQALQRSMQTNRAVEIIANVDWHKLSQTLADVIKVEVIPSANEFTLYVPAIAPRVKTLSEILTHKEREVFRELIIDTCDKGPFGQEYDSPEWGSARKKILKALEL